MRPAARQAARPILLCLSLFALTACETKEIDAEGNEVTKVAVSPPSACEPVLFEEIHLTHCVADPATHAIHTALTDAEGEPYGSLAAYAAARGTEGSPVVFAMNGGMYEEDLSPVGYFVSERERLARLNRRTGEGNFYMKPNGVFFGNASDGWRVRETGRFAEEVDQRPDFGTQSGPMLLTNGQINPQFDPQSQSLHIRNAVGVDRAGRAHFVISEDPVSFDRLARYFRDVLETPNALYLDGAVSQLWDPRAGRLDNGPPIGPLIVVEMREQGG